MDRRDLGNESGNISEGVPSLPETSIGGDLITLGNEFAEVTLRKVRTHNGSRLEISSPRLGRTISLCPLELESLTWQSREVFSEFLSTPLGHVDSVPEP
jgi:hypothetical protein